jgi:D-beta-D-heptose 7-phosphate kinase/D-beta-D-heptose 1-phosphate adenosyltransferase
VFDLERFSSVSVVVVGDLMLDEYVWGSVSRISPEAPVPILRIDERTNVPGGAANAAVGVAAMGAQSKLIGVTGSDAPADLLLEATGRYGVDVSSIVADAERPTILKTRLIAHSQHVVRADIEAKSPLPQSVDEEIRRRSVTAVELADAVLISDYAKGVVTADTARAVIEAAARLGKPVIVDPKGLHYERYRGATIVTPNVDDAARAANVHISSEQDVQAVADRLRSTCDGSALLLTRGAAGMTLFSDGPCFSVPAEAREVFDVTGAGDTVVSVLAVMLGAGAGFEESVRLANIAAGVAVGRVGTTAVTRQELFAALRARALPENAGGSA